MVYLTNNSDKVAFPCTTTNDGTNYVVKISNTTTKKEYTYTLLNYSNSNSYYYFNVASILADTIDAGQYKYTIEKESVILDCGLMQFGDYTRTATQYENEINFNQYNG